MANGILSLIQPNGSDKFNLRAESVFYFKPDSSGTVTPASGFVSFNETNHTMYFSHDNIMSIQDGMIIAFESPNTIDYEDVVFISNGTKLNTTPLKITNTVDNRNGCRTFNQGEFYIMVYDGQLNFRVINTHLIETVASNSTRPVTSKAVYEFVTEKLANRFTYVLSNSAATTPNATKYGTTQGTLAASADTEFKIYLVSHTHETGKDVYDEWITVKNGSTYSWEKIGNTDMAIDLDSIISNISDHTFTPGGTVSKPTFTGNKVATDSKGAHTHSVTATGSVSSTFKGDTVSLEGTSAGHYHSIAANKCNVSADYTPAGTVTGGFTGTSATTSTAEAHFHKIEQDAIVSTGSYQPVGTVSQPTFKGDTATIESTLSEDFKVSEDGSHNHSIPQLTSTGTYQPEGTITASWTGTGATIASSNTELIQTNEVEAHKHSFAANALTVTSSYTPAGSVSIPSVGVDVKNSSGTAMTLYSISGVGKPSSYTVSGEVLTLTPGTVPSRTQATITTKATSSNLSGTAATITSKNPSIQYVSTAGAHYHKFEPGTIVVSGTYTPAGSVSATFAGKSKSVSVKSTATTTGNGGEHQHTISADTFKVSGSYQPTGTVSKPTFKGDTATITVRNGATGTATAGSHNHTVTATGNLSNLAFSGTKATINSTNTAAIATNSNSDKTTISYQPTGKISSTFTGTPATTDEQGAHTHDVTATGTVSQPTFSGTQITLPHTKKS